MGTPKSESIDKYITYPLMQKILIFFKNIHPIYITSLCIITKIYSIYLLNYFTVNTFYLLTFFLFLERGLDCLDGEVARHYNKCTKIGHYMDKYSDLFFRIGMIYTCLNHILTAHVWSIYTYIFSSLLVSLPGVYVIDYFRGMLSNDLVCDSRGIAIIVEDNATIICFLLPYLLLKIS